MGIVAPRASFAVVRVNGRIEGLYGMVEQIDGRFAADRWPQFPDGNLYKEVWPTDTDEPFILGRLKTNEDEADISSFLQFTTAINQAQNPTEVLRILGEHTDLDYWARYMAVDDALPNADGITFLYTSDVQNFHNHNYYFYEDAPGHFTLIPWDLEGVFWDFSSSNKAPHWQTPDDCTSMYDYWESNHAVAPRCDPLLDALNLDLAPWRAYAQQLLEGPFSQESMEKNIQRHQEFIRDAIKRFGTSVSPSFFGTEVEYLKTYGIPGQRTRLKKLISNSQ